MLNQKLLVVNGLPSLMISLQASVQLGSNHSVLLCKHYFFPCFYLLLLLLLIFIFIFYFFAMPHGMQDLSSPTRDQTCVSCIASAVSATGLLWKYSPILLPRFKMLVSSHLPQHSHPLGHFRGLTLVESLVVELLPMFRLQTSLVCL